MKQECEDAAENIMLHMILDEAQDFFAVAENLQAYEVWKKGKEKK